jgi:glycosyltransferase involved in cell wall biosynthesis
VAGVSGPRVALFHDATALRLPELSPAKTVARYPVYLQELLIFDGIAAISEDSRAALADYWRWLGIANPPPVIGLPLGIDPPPPPVYGHTVAPQASPVVLSVGSIEGRKNHLALLEACERLWQRGLRFELQLIGLHHPQTGRAAADRVRALQASGRPLHYEGPASEAGLQDAYRTCVFTVYPSLMEGFGLPVLESLGHGKPCICSGQGALGESAHGGGCLTLDRVDAPALADAIASLLSDPDRLGRLTDDARSRTFKNWSTYAGELVSWMGTLARRDPAAPQG